ncbi:hypothetical protein SR882_10935 [Guyparkeria halophila]|uniref:IrrE N-terminal-like domain-containing protein n=1 Tax=Guyparkeria halophila TaxID=47960 RepID=A0ABZ0YVP4_9GAMM|nr:hypothetical protein [Guyparkeria halophila]WQH16260.1 hypothetical protein SR882_10935 [Guyparkeria halophila]
MSASQSIKPGFTPPPDDVVIDEAAVLRLSDLPNGALDRLVARYALSLAWVALGESIPGSFWGDDEAGIIGETLQVRPDTAVHSALHEFAHIVCMDPSRRAQAHTDAGSGDGEEEAVCYLQILMADHLEGFDRERALADMQAWGYTFRVGSPADWFAADANRASDWLLAEGLVLRGDHGLEPTFHPRGTA